MDIDRRMTSLNVLQVCYFSVCFYISGVQTIFEIVCYLDFGLFFVVVVLFYVHGKYLRSCQDGQLT